MPSTLNAYLLSAVMLAVLARCVTGSPVGYAPTESTSGDPSGEELQDERCADLLSKSPVWDTIIAVTKRHENQFEEEFQRTVKYNLLEHYEVPSPPAGCPSLNFSKESCLHRLVQGLQKYRVLLKHVEKEYPSNSILPEVKLYSDGLVSLIKGKMKHPERVKELVSSQEQQLLRELDNPDSFRRKMTAHSILRRLQSFLKDGKNAVAKKEFLSRWQVCNN